MEYSYYKPCGAKSQLQGTIHGYSGYSAVTEFVLVPLCGAKT